MNISLVILVAVGILLSIVGRVLLFKNWELSIASGTVGGICIVLAIAFGWNSYCKAESEKRKDALENTYIELVQKVHDDMEQYGGISLGTYKEIERHNKDIEDGDSFPSFFDEDDYFIDLSGLTLAVRNDCISCSCYGDKLV